MADVPPEVSSSTLDYFLIEYGKSTGPHKAIEVWAKIQTGKITCKTPAWTAGLEEWKRLHKSIWKEHGIHIPEDAQADTKTEQQEGDRRQDKAEQEKEELTEAQSYHLVLELGLWEKLLNDISEKDSLEDLEDMKYLRSLKEKIDGLSGKLNKNGIIKGSPHAYVSSEYDAFDKDAEEVEKKILKFAQETKSNGFLNDFLNSSSKEDGLHKLDKIKRGVHALCVDFRQRNAHRILWGDSLKIWELFAEKFGEDEDIPLIQDLIMVAGWEDADSLHAASSPVLSQLGNILRLLEDLLGSDGKIRTDNYEILQKLSKLFNKNGTNLDQLFERKLQLLQSASNKFVGKWENASRDQKKDQSFLKSSQQACESELERLKSLFQEVSRIDLSFNKIFDVRLKRSISQCTEISKQIKDQQKSQASDINEEIKNRLQWIKEKEKEVNKNRFYFFGWTILWIILAILMINQLNNMEYQPW